MSLESNLLSQISYIAVILLIGLLVAILSKKLKLPDVLLLIISGIALGFFIKFENLPLNLPKEFIAGLGIFALVLIVFESTTGMRFRELDWFTKDSLKVTFSSVFFMVVLFTLGVWGVLFRFSQEGMLPSAIFGVLMAGTAPDVILSLLKKSKNKVVEVLEIESIINTPVVVLLPLLVIEIGREFTSGIVSGFLSQVLVNIITGIGTGVVVGLVLFKAMKNAYSEIYSPIAVIAAALVSYSLAETIGGNGILAVTTLGLFFGNLEIRQKVSLLRFESVLATLLRVLIFVLIGAIIEFPLNLWFYINSLILFALYLLVRWISLEVSARNFTRRERIFMTLSASKGLPVIIVTFILATVLGGFESVLNYILIIVLYSLLLAALTSKFGMGLIEEDRTITAVKKDIEMKKKKIELAKQKIKEDKKKIVNAKNGRK